MDFPSRAKSFHADTEHLVEKAQDLPVRINYPDSSLSASVACQEDKKDPFAGSTTHIPLEAQTMSLLSILNPISPEAFEELKRDHNLDIVGKPKNQGPQSCKMRMKYRANKKRHNKAYTAEQVHYIMYHREDLELPWIEVRDKYRERYNVTDCFEGALQSRHYRAQLVPFLDIKANPVLDTKGAVIMRKMTVRERNYKTWTVPILDSQRRPVTDERNRILMRELTEAERDGPMGAKLKHTLDKYFKLGDRLPGLLCKYKDWVKLEHQEEGEKKGLQFSNKTLRRDDGTNTRSEKHRLDHGIVLPGATHCGGEYVNTVVAVNAAGAILSDEFRHACYTSSGLPYGSRPKL